jgi:tRNA (adenine22-N1)-methyltransferase
VKLKLSERLLAIAALVPLGARVADIGTDHALLPCYLVGSEKATSVIGVDVHRGPYERAWQTVRECSLEEYIEIRLGDGLTVLKPGEVDTVVIAGMGGTAISNIFAESPQVVGSLRKVILQPMNNPAAVRNWLWEHGWEITAEDLIFEDKQYYQLIGAENAPSTETARTTAAQSTGVSRSTTTVERSFFPELAAEYGPLLIRHIHPLLPGLLERDQRAMQVMLEQLAKSSQEDVQLRYREAQQQMQKMKELREWLLVAKPSSM